MARLFSQRSNDHPLLMDWSIDTFFFSFLCFGQSSTSLFIGPFRPRAWTRPIIHRVLHFISFERKMRKKKSKNWMKPMKFKASQRAVESMIQKRNIPFKHRLKRWSSKLGNQDNDKIRRYILVSEDSSLLSHNWWRCIVIPLQLHWDNSLYSMEHPAMKYMVLHCAFDRHMWNHSVPKKPVKTFDEESSKINALPNILSLHIHKYHSRPVLNPMDMKRDCNRHIEKNHCRSLKGRKPTPVILYRDTWNHSTSVMNYNH